MLTAMKACLRHGIVLHHFNPALAAGHRWECLKCLEEKHKVIEEEGKTDKLNDY